MAMNSVIQNASLIKKVYIPKYIFPISRVFSSFVTMSFSLVAILIVMLATGTPFHFSILLFWIPILFLLFFSCGIGMILAALAVQFRDIMHLYSVIMFNPLYKYINIFRSLVLYGTIPEPGLWVSGALTAIVSLALGVLIFRKAQRNFILYI